MGRWLTTSYLNPLIVAMSFQGVALFLTIAALPETYRILNAGPELRVNAYPEVSRCTCVAIKAAFRIGFNRVCCAIHRILNEI